jgi:hypothetical protein
MNIKQSTSFQENELSFRRKRSRISGSELAFVSAHSFFSMFAFLGSLTSALLFFRKYSSYFGDPQLEAFDLGWSVETEIEETSAFRSNSQFGVKRVRLNLKCPSVARNGLDLKQMVVPYDFSHNGTKMYVFARVFLSLGFCLALDDVQVVKRLNFP